MTPPTEKLWTELTDGDVYHAVHIAQLADDAAERAAALTLGLGAAGHFIAPDGATQCRNWLGFDAASASVELEAISVLTHGGYLARLRAPRKSFPIPDEACCYLNLYARSFVQAGGRTEARWESEPTQDPRGVALVRWQRDERALTILPRPFLLAAQSQVSELHARLREAVDVLLAALHGTGAEALSRLQLEPDQRHWLERLHEALERMRSLTESTPLERFLAEGRALAEQLAGWLRYVSARADGRAVSPEPWARRALLREPPLAGPVVVDALLAGDTSSGTAVARWLELLRKALLTLVEILTAQALAVRLTLVTTGVPDGWPRGERYTFALAPPASKSQVRCEVDASTEPVLYSAQCSTGASIALGLHRLKPERILAPGLRRFGATFPADPNGGDLLVIVVDPRPIALRAFLERVAAPEAAP